MEYSTEVRRRFSALASAGTMPSDDGSVVAGAAEDRSLGFWVRFQVKLCDARIETVRFQAYGCPHALAAADLVAGKLEGMPPESLTCFAAEDVMRRLEVPREKLGKLLRIEDALTTCYQMAVSKERG